MAEAALQIKNTQTTLAIETFFKKLSKMPEKRDDVILSLAEHLVMSKIITPNEMDELKRKYPQTNALIMRMEALIKRRDTDTWRAILRWLELKPMMLNELLPAVEKNELQYALEELYNCERDVTAQYGTCMDKLIRIAGFLGYRVGSESENEESMYEALHNALWKFKPLRNFRYIPVDKLRGVLTRELTKSKPDKMHMRAIPKESLTWQSFVGAMKTPKSSGNPFIFYAAARYFKIPIYVVSAISGEVYTFHPFASREEYMFYPFDYLTLTSRRERFFPPHITIGHVYKKYYVSLYQTEHPGKDRYHDPKVSDFSFNRQITLVNLDRLHREKYYIENELGEIKHELRRLKVEKGNDSIDSKSRNNYQKQIEQLKDQLATYEKEKHEKEELVKSHNEQLKSYEQMLKKSMDETKKLRQYIEHRDEKFRRELEEKTEEQKRIIEDFVAQTSDRASGASVRAINTWSQESGPRDLGSVGQSPRTSRRQPDTSRGYSPSHPRERVSNRSFSPSSYDRQHEGSNVQVYGSADLPNSMRKNTYTESRRSYERRPPSDKNWQQYNY